MTPPAEATVQTSTRRADGAAQPAPAPGVSGDGRAGPPVALITGCSTGIGRATDARLTAAGYRVVASARQRETLEGLGAAMALSFDVTEPVSIAGALKTALGRYGRVDVLVNNAGYAMRGAVEEVDAAAVGRLFDVNVFGIVRMVQVVAPVMNRERAGRIVNVGSLVGKLPGPARRR